MKVQHNTDYNAIHSNTFKAQKAYIHQLEERGKSSYDKISDSVNIKHAEYGRSDNIIKTLNLSGNCCAPGILVHPCARREVHFILTFLLHFVILHFKFRYKVFSIRIAF